MVGYEVTDEYGFTQPNNYVQLFLPGYTSSIVLYVKYRHNPTWSLTNYGPLPFTTATAYSAYNGVGGGVGGSPTATVAGELPASAWIKGVQFNVPSTFNVVGSFPYGNSDIWYTQTNSRLFEVKQWVSPSWVRIACDVPTGQNQETFQDTVAGGVDQDFGWSRGKYRTAHIPYIHYGYGYGNDTNAPCYTGVAWRYAEQEVSLCKDPNLVFQIINGMYPANTYELPIVTKQTQIDTALNQAYGFTGFPIYPKTKQAEAVAAYQALINSNPKVLGGLI